MGLLEGGFILLREGFEKGKKRRHWQEAEKEVNI